MPLKIIINDIENKAEKINDLDHEFGNDVYDGIE